jgi:hypothetical protein
MLSCKIDYEKKVQDCRCADCDRQMDEMHAIEDRANQAQVLDFQQHALKSTQSKLADKAKAQFERNKLVFAVAKKEFEAIMASRKKAA